MTQLSGWTSSCMWQIFFASNHSFGLKFAQNFFRTCCVSAPVNQPIEFSWCVMSPCVQPHVASCFYSHCIMMSLNWTSCIKLPIYLFFFWCHITCNDAHEPSPLPCTAHIYDHWFEWQPYLYKQISFIWFVGLQWTRLQLCLLLILCRILVWIEF